MTNRGVKKKKKMKRIPCCDHEQFLFQQVSINDVHNHSQRVDITTESQRHFFQQHWLKTDFDKWRDEDDSDEEAGNDKDMQLEEVRVVQETKTKAMLFPASKNKSITAKAVVYGRQRRSEGSLPVDSNFIGHKYGNVSKSGLLGDVHDRKSIVQCH